MSSSTYIHKTESLSPWKRGTITCVDAVGQPESEVHIFFKNPSELVRQLHACLDAALRIERAALEDTDE